MHPQATATDPLQTTFPSTTISSTVHLKATAGQTIPTTEVSTIATTLTLDPVIFSTFVVLSTTEVQTTTTSTASPCTIGYINNTTPEQAPETTTNPQMVDLYLCVNSKNPRRRRKGKRTPPGATEIVHPPTYKSNIGTNKCQRHSHIKS
jgi:hypothetical protein